MSTFATMVAHRTTLSLVPNSSPIPDGRFASEPLYWISIPQTTIINTLATGVVTFAGSGTGVIPGSTNPNSSWTMFELSPLPQTAPSTFKSLACGLPVQIVLVTDQSVTGPAKDDFLVAGTPLVTAPSSPTVMTFLGLVFQDRICRDPLTWAEMLANTGACNGDWTQFTASVAALPGSRNLRVLDHVGRPLERESVRVSIDGAPSTTVDLTHQDGNTNIPVPDSSKATVYLGTSVEPIVAAVGNDEGSFENGLTLLPSARLVQVLDADRWFASVLPFADTLAVERWHPNSNLEPIVDGTPYFDRLVKDFRRTNTSINAVEFAGWEFVKGSQDDPTVDWSLVPGDDTTTLLKLVTELTGHGAQVQFLVNRMIQFDSPALDDFSGKISWLLFGVFAALIPLQAFSVVTTDPAGFILTFAAITAANMILASPTGEDIITKLKESSKDTVDALNLLNPDPSSPKIAIWTPYPATFADNPLAPQPFSIAGFQIDDISHIGVYHQKLVNIKAHDPSGDKYISYMGGIDLNSDRIDTPLHRAIHPFHDVQVRITGPACKDLIRTYAGRFGAQSSSTPAPTLPISATDLTIGTAGTHLIQIARTYYQPAAGSPASPLAAQGESTPIQTIKAAIAQARDFIYIEDQYFTPPDEYVQALLDAACPERGVRALFITCPYQADQPFGGVRRADIFKQLGDVWQDRLIIRAPFRRFLHPTPALTTNLGRMCLYGDIDSSSSGATFGPISHIPLPPFWAFIGGELVRVENSATTDDTINGVPVRKVQITRGGGWGATPVAHSDGEAVLCVQIPEIYVHAKVMVIDDIFLFVGSSNLNRRGFYHDGELNSFTVPQHLKADPSNPARLLRCRLMAEHLGLPPEMGISLFADPLSVVPYYQRSWYVGAHSQLLEFMGATPLNNNFSSGDSLASELIHLAIPIIEEIDRDQLWSSLIDPTTNLEPAPRQNGPNFP